MFCTIITRMYISRHDIVIMMQVIIHHFHHYNRARQDWLCCHVTNSCYFFVFHFLSGCQGRKWVLFLEWNVSIQVKTEVSDRSFMIRETTIGDKMS